MRAPYGWQHTWQGYPETPFPASTNPPSFGITGTDMTYLSGRRVEKTRKGIFIINGKKVAVK